MTQAKKSDGVFANGAFAYEEHVLNLRMVLIKDETSNCQLMMPRNFKMQIKKDNRVQQIIQKLSLTHGISVSHGTFTVSCLCPMET